MLLILQLSVLAIIEFGACFNDLPSLMIANVVMVVVIEKPFFERTYIRSKHNSRRSHERNLTVFTEVLTNAAKKRMIDAGVAVEMIVTYDTNFNLGNDYTALLSVASCDETWNLFKRARKEELVHLAITGPDCPRLPITHGISVPILDSGEELPQIFLDLRMSEILNWKRINVLHDHAFESDTIGRVLKSVCGEIPNNSYLGLASEVLLSTHSANSELATKRLIVETLEKFQPRERNNENFLVIVNNDMVPSIIDAARSLGMLHPQSLWLFVLPNSTHNSTSVTGLGGFLAEGDNIAIIYNNTNFNQTCEQGVECHASEMVGALGGAVQDILKQETELYDRVTEEEFDAVRIMKPERRQRIVENIRTELYGETSEDNSWTKCGDCINWRIMTGMTWGNSFVRENKTEHHRLIKVGYWIPGPGPCFKDLLFPHSKYGFRGKSLPIVTYYNPPWQYTTKSKKTGELRWVGLVFDIVDQLSRNLNFTYRLVDVAGASQETYAKSEDSGNRSDGTVEEFVRTITSSGAKVPDAVVQLVTGGNVLMAACATTITDRLRRLSLNFTAPISIETYGLLASRPKQMSRLMLFASPYTTESWACLTGGILLIGPILYVVHKYSPSPADDDSATGLGSPARCLWYVYGALLQQGGMHLPQNDGARLIVGTWWLVVMILVATYSGSLVAFLTFPRMHESISSIEDLLRHKDELTWSLPAKSFLENYLNSGKSEKYDGLLGVEGRPAERHDSSNYANAVNRVKKGTHILVDWTSSLRMLTRADNPLTKDGICHFSIGTETFIEEPMGFLVPSNSPYLGLINNELKRMHESGLIGKWKSDRITTMDQCWEASGVNRQVDNHKVDVWDMQGIFFVLIFGYLIAVAFLAWEFYSHHRKLAKERNLIRPFIS